MKVTYLPEGYVKDHRKSHGLRPELTLMKGLAREFNIGFDKSAPDSILNPDLWRKLDDSPQRSARELISELQGCREALLDDCIANPEPLVRWLYQNQGVRRFDASNRLFLVLVDKSDFFNSWKLKRARSLISEHVTNYLATVNQDTGFQLDFLWEDKIYSTEKVETVYTTFEVLNNRGLVTSWLDRFKNRLMEAAFQADQGNSNEQIDELHEIWGSFYRTMGYVRG